MCCVFPLCTGHTRVGTTLCSVEEEALEKETYLSLQTLSPPELRGRTRAGLRVRVYFCLINSTEHLSEKSSTVVKASLTEAPYGKHLADLHLVSLMVIHHSFAKWLSSSAFDVEVRLEVQTL